MAPLLNHRPQDSSYGERIVRLETVNDTQEEKIDKIVDKIDDLVEAVHSLSTGQQVLIAQFKDFEIKGLERYQVAFSAIDDYKKHLEDESKRFSSIENCISAHQVEFEKREKYTKWAETFSQPKNIISLLLKILFFPIVLIGYLFSKCNFEDVSPLLKMLGFIK